MLEHSQKNYGPLLRRVRSRTYSRPSPYPPRSTKRSFTSDEPRPVLPDEVDQTFASVHHPLQARSTNVMTPAAVPALKDLNPISPFDVEFEKSKGDSFHGRTSTRPRVTSSARRNALGWTKRSTGKSSDLKENAAIGMLTT